MDETKPNVVNLLNESDAASKGADIDLDKLRQELSAAATPAETVEKMVEVLKTDEENPVPEEFRTAPTTGDIRMIFNEGIEALIEMARHLNLPDTPKIVGKLKGAQELFNLQ